MKLICVAPSEKEQYIPVSAMQLRESQQSLSQKGTKSLGILKSLSLLPAAMAGMKLAIPSILVSSEQGFPKFQHRPKTITLESPRASRVSILPAQLYLLEHRYWNRPLF